VLAFALAKSVRQQLFRDWSDLIDEQVARRIPAIMRRLRRLYPRGDRLGNKHEPLNELVYIMLSRRTHDRQFRQGYKALRHAFPTWDSLLAAPRSVVERVIAPLGFGKQRADHLIEALRKIKRDFGRLSLARLRRWDTSAALNYLMSLKGVNEKTAKCVSMYSLGREVFPVDTHVLRMSKRIGLIHPDTSEYLAARPLEMLVPGRLRSGLHIAMVQHGRAVCVPGEPRCDECTIRSLCEYGRARAQKRRR
jgi:endonuclease III